MSRARPLLRLDDPVGGWHRPWPQAFEIARALPPGSWTLVGGLMVQLHALLAGLQPSRPTTDVDAALHLETGSVTYADAVADLRRLQYELDRSAMHTYRFQRGDDTIDLMTADHLAPSLRARFAGKDVFAVTGGTQALRRTMDVDVATADDIVRLSVPNIHGALVLKGAAYLADGRDRDRHASDAVMLLACLTDSREVLDRLAGSDGKRLRALVGALDAPAPWSDATRDVEALARTALAELRSAL